MTPTRGAPFLLAALALSLSGCCFPNIWGGGPINCPSTPLSFSTEPQTTQFTYSLRSGCAVPLEIVDRDGGDAEHAPVLEPQALFNYVVDAGAASKGRTTAHQVSIWARPAGQQVAYRGAVMRLRGSELTLIPLRCPSEAVTVGPGEPEPPPPAPARPATSAAPSDWKTFLHDAP